MAKKTDNTDKLDSALPTMPTQTRGEVIAFEMASAGFKKSQALSPHCVEFTKIYTDPSGTTGKVTAVLRKDDAGVEADVIEAFVLTIQKTIRATMEDIHAGSWHFAKADLLHLIDVLGAVDEVGAENHVISVECDLCKTPTPEFIKVKDLTLCKTCWEQSKT